MRITKLSWTNYKGLTNDEIVADGADVIVRGQNGAGKSSIAELVSFILFGAQRMRTTRMTMWFPTNALIAARK